MPSRARRRACTRNRTRRATDFAQQLFFEMETEERASFTAMLLRASPLFASVPSVAAEVGQRRQCLPHKVMRQ